MRLAASRGVSIALSFETIEFRRFETDGDIDWDLPRVDNHGWLTITVRLFDVSSHRCGAPLSDVIQGEQHSERELIEHGRQYRIKSSSLSSSAPAPVWTFGKSLLNGLHYHISKPFGSSVSEFHVAVWCETNKVNIILARSLFVVSYDEQCWQEIILRVARVQDTSVVHDLEKENKLVSRIILFYDTCRLMSDQAKNDRLLPSHAFAQFFCSMIDQEDQVISSIEMLARTYLDSTKVRLR